MRASLDSATLPEDGHFFSQKCQGRGQGDIRWPEVKRSGQRTKKPATELEALGQTALSVVFKKTGHLFSL